MRRNKAQFISAVVIFTQTINVKYKGTLHPIPPQINNVFVHIENWKLYAVCFVRKQHTLMVTNNNTIRWWLQIPLLQIPFQFVDIFTPVLVNNSNLLFGRSTSCNAITKILGLIALILQWAKTKILQREQDHFSRICGQSLPFFGTHICLKNSMLIYRFQKNNSFET